MSFTKKRRHLFGTTGSLIPNSTKLSPLSAKNCNTVEKKLCSKFNRDLNPKKIFWNKLFQEIDSNRCCAKNCRLYF
jgi:hypothetical protein